MRYAISEIILVVLGILIAVGINNWNEHKKQEAELLNIFSIVKKELSGDTSEINKLITYYDRVAPIFNKVLNDSLAKADYMENKGYAFLIIGFPEISIDKRGYELIRNFNTGSNNYQDSLVSIIVDFYTERLLEIGVDDELRANDFDDNFNYWKENYDWWGDFIHFKKIDGFVDYAVNDQDYKNRVATSYFITYDVFLPELQKFKEKATAILQLIEGREK